MLPVHLSNLQPSRDEEIEEWPWLDQEMLRSSRSRQVCMTCHFFQHHLDPNCTPLLRHRRERSSEAAIRLWGDKRKVGWVSCIPQW